MANKRKSSSGRTAVPPQCRAAARAARRAPNPSLSTGAAIALGFGLSASQARADTFVVTTLEDTGPGSLRAAIDDANSVDGADMITFQSGLTGTITLTSAELKIQDSVAIQGPGASVLSVSGDDKHRVFYLAPYINDLDVTIAGLKITGGLVTGNGAGIQSGAARLMLDAVEISGNVAGPLTTGQGGGLWASAGAMGVTIIDSVISGNAAKQGGGVFVALDGTLDIQTSQISGNDAQFGAGMWIDGAAKSITVEQSTLSANHAMENGGAIHVRATGAEGTFMIRASTLSGNTASHGGALSLGKPVAPTIVENSTISGNQGTEGGAIHCDECASLAVRHSTIAGNTATSDGAIVVSEGLGTLSHTIIADNTAPNNQLLGMFAADHSLIETPGTSTITDGGGNVLGQDPQLGPLQANGGPTLTQLPAATSPAINAGNAGIVSAPPYDQRGRARAVGDRIDIGAVERNSGALQCSAADVTVSESATSVTLMVTRTGGTDGDVSVSYATTNGTATAPDDYASASMTLQWSNGEGAAKSIELSIIDDERADPNEAFTTTLSNATGTALGPVSASTVTITDDDAAPTVTEIGALNVTAGGSTSPVAFTVGDADDGTANLTLSATSSNHSVIADVGVTFGGSAQGRTLTVTALEGGAGESTVTVSVSDGTNVTARSFTVTVNAVPGTETDAGPAPGETTDAGPPEPSADAGTDAGTDAGAMPADAGTETTTNAATRPDAAADGGDDSWHEPDIDDPRGSSSDSNCGCEVPGRNAPAPKSLIAGLLGLAGVALRRRRRSARS
jgi:MYXO-CTERM domain-containing protein